MKTLSEIDFGDDVSLYRSAADTLQTNDTMLVGGSSGVHLKPNGRAAIAATIADTQMLTVGAFGGSNQFNSTNPVTGIAAYSVNADIGNVTALSATACNTVASGAAGALHGAVFYIRLASAGATVGTGRAIYAGTPTVTAGGTITNAYGLDIMTQATTGVTNAWGIYQRGANDTNYFAGLTQVGGSWGMQAKPIGRVSIACSLSDDLMLGVGSVGGANQFNTTNTVMGIGSWPQNGGTGQIYGLVVQPCCSPASATVNQIWGAHISVRVASSTATLNNGRALFVGTPSISAGGIIVNAYGVEINPQATTGVTNAYGIYQRGTTDYNVLLGNTGMGVTAPTLSRLQFPAGTLAADGITWGTDVNLYRLSANVLRSDDQVSCVGVDLNKNEALNLVTHKLAAAPASPVTGQRYHDTATKTERFYDGTGWTTIADLTYVNPSAPAGTLNAGDLWWDTDDAAPGITTPLGVTDGGTGATAPATARASLSVPGIGSSTSVAGAPTAGTWARGDQWLDSAGVVWTCVTAGTPGAWTAPPGTELAYNQITSQVNVTATTESGPNLVIEGTSRSYDGAPILIDCFFPSVYMSTASQMVFNLWDAGTDLGRLGASIVSGNGFMSHLSSHRRLTPAAGVHNYRVVSWLPVGTGASLIAGTGAGTYMPGFIRVTRA